MGDLCAQACVRALSPRPQDPRHTQYMCAQCPVAADVMHTTSTRRPRAHVPTIVSIDSITDLASHPRVPEPYKLVRIYNNNETRRAGLRAGGRVGRPGGKLIITVTY